MWWNHFSTTRSTCPLHSANPRHSVHVFLSRGHVIHTADLPPLPQDTAQPRKPVSFLFPNPRPSSQMATDLNSVLQNGPALNNSGTGFRRSSTGWWWWCRCVCVCVWGWHSLFFLFGTSPEARQQKKQSCFYTTTTNRLDLYSEWATGRVAAWVKKTVWQWCMQCGNKSNEL